MTALTHEPVSECPFKQGQRLGEESSYQDGSAVQYLNAHHTHISGLLSTKKLYKNIIMKENNLQVIHFQTHTHTRRNASSNYLVPFSSGETKAPKEHGIHCKFFAAFSTKLPLPSQSTPVVLLNSAR